MKVGIYPMPDNNHKGHVVTIEENEMVIKGFPDGSSNLTHILAIRWCNENDHEIVRWGSEYANYPKMPNVIAMSESLELLQDEMTQKTIDGYVVTGGITKVDDEWYTIPMSLKSVVDGSWKPEEGVLVEEYI